MHLEGEDPSVRKRWGRDGMIWGTPGVVAVLLYFVFAWGMPFWLVPIIAVAWVPVGYVMGAGYYNQTLWMRNLLGKGPPK